MSTLATAPIGVPPALGLWSRLKGLLTAPAMASLEHRVDELELEVSVLQAQALNLQLNLNNLQLQVDTWGAPRAPLPTDVYIAGKRHSKDGVLYITTTVAGTDRFIAGSRVSDQGDQVTATGV